MLANNGLATPPCGVPCVLATMLPSSCSTPVFNQRAAYSITHFSCVCCCNSCSMMSWLMLSKNPFISTSITHAYLIQLSWHCLIASCALLPGLYPNELG